jgi:hypothetical protein
MTNKKHTIKQSRWWDYPVLRDGQYREPFKYKDKYSTVVVKIGLQDGISVSGFRYDVDGHIPGNGGAGCNPGRKWGEFSSEKEAELFTIKLILKEFQSRYDKYKNIRPRVSKAIKAMQERIAKLRYGEQIELFQ